MQSKRIWARTAAYEQTEDEKWAPWRHAILAGQLEKNEPHSPFDGLCLPPELVIDGKGKGSFLLTHSCLFEERTQRDERI
jgi:hypothetical protein